MSVNGERIKERRIALGLSQQQLAGQELTRSFISQLEQNKVKPSLTTLELIASRLGKPIDYFISEERSDQLSTASVLERVARDDVEHGRWKDAVQSASGALAAVERLGRPEMEARVRLLLARSLLFSFDLEGALEQYERLVDDCKALNDRAPLCEAHYYLGITFQMMENYSCAQRHYLRTVQLCEEKKSLQETRAGALVNLGTCYSVLGQTEKSVQAFEQVVDGVSAAEFPQVCANAYQGMSLNMRRTQHWREALYFARKALEIFERTDARAAVNARHSVALARVELGELEQAYHELAACLQSYRDAGSKQGEARVLSTMALYHLKREDSQQTEVYCKEALRVLDLADDGITRGVVYRRMAQAHMIRGNMERARELLRMSVDILRRVKARDQLEESVCLLAKVAEV